MSVVDPASLPRSIVTRCSGQLMQSAKTKTRKERRMPTKKSSKVKPAQPVKAEAASELPAALPAPSITPVHQWTHDGDRVLLLKCVDADGKSYNGFAWNPNKAVAPYPIHPAACSRAADCESGGLFGWPWGVGIGGSKTPDYHGQWIVFSAPPSQVIDLGDKAKVCANSPSEVDCRVEFIGHWSRAVNLILDGRVAWTRHASSGAASATGWSGAASATGESGAASATGESGAASATGERGAASATGGRGVAAITGPLSTIEIGPRDAGVVTVDEFTWIVRRGAVLLHRWEEGHATLVADGSIPDGTRVHVKKGIMQP